MNREMCFHKKAKCGKMLTRTKAKRMPPATTAYACVISIDSLGSAGEEG